MTPYYDDGTCVIYHGDCREILPQLDLSAVGVVIADPPYGETSLTWDRWQTGWTTVVDQETAIPISLWCFGSMRMFLDRARDFATWTLAQDIVWEKHNGSSSAADRFRRVHEHALQWYRGPWADIWRAPVTTPDATKRQVRRKERPPQWGEIAGTTYRSEDGGPRLARSVMRVRSCHGHALHPTEKPLGILEPLIRYSTPPGAVVLDPFAGSASTLVAAREAGYKAIGIEADAQYCEIAAKRLAQGALDFGGVA